MLSKHKNSFSLKVKRKHFPYPLNSVVQLEAFHKWKVLSPVVVFVVVVVVVVVVV